MNNNMSSTVLVYLDGVKGMIENDHTTWTTALEWPVLTAKRFTTRSSDGKAHTENNKPECEEISLSIVTNDNLTGNIHTHFFSNSKFYKKVIIAEVADRNQKSLVPILKWELENVLSSYLVIDRKADRGLSICSMNLDFQNINTQYGHGNDKVDIVWKKDNRQY